MPVLETALNELPVGSESPGEFKQALRDATRVAGFDRLADLAAKTGLSRGTLSPAFSKNKPMPTEATITAIVQAVRGDVTLWLARSRRVSGSARSPEAARQSGTGNTVASATTAMNGPPELLANATDSSIMPQDDHQSTDETDTRRRVGDSVSSAMHGRNARLVKGGIGAVLVVILALTVALIWPHRDKKTPERTIVVQNEVAIGASELVEDNSPSYLAADPIAKCADVPGCKLTGTDLHTGDTVEAVCQLQGTLLTNANLDSPGIKENPHVAASALWYGVKWSDGRRGYINEVYIAPNYRGGLGLPKC